MAPLRDESVSPELVLVCPELRTAALAALPVREPDAWLDRLVSSPEEAPEYRLLRSFADDEETTQKHEHEHEPEPEWSAPLPVAIVAYTVERAAKVTVEMTALLGAVAALLSIVAVARW